MMIDILDDTFFVDDENYPVVETIFGQDPQFPADFSVGPEIGQKRIGDPA